MQTNEAGILIHREHELFQADLLGNLTFMNRQSQKSNAVLAQRNKWEYLEL